jgi:hypothetical protein
MAGDTHAQPERHACRHNSDGHKRTGRVSVVHDRSIPSEEDPLGLAALLARLGEPDPEIEPIYSPPASTRAAPPVDESISVRHTDDAYEHDLATLASMAREVEEARFAAETRLYAQLRATAERERDVAAAEAAAEPTARTTTQPMPTPHAAAPSEPTLTDWHQELAAVVAASAADLAAAGTPAPQPTLDPEPERVPPAPTPRPTGPTSRTDTAALLRELASLGGDDRADEPSAPPPARPSAPGRPAASGGGNGSNAKGKRKGLFGR